MPDMAQRLDKPAIDLAPKNPATFGQFIRAQIAGWAKVIKDGTIPPQ